MPSASWMFNFLLLVLLATSRDRQGILLESKQPDLLPRCHFREDITWSRCQVWRSHQHHRGQEHGSYCAKHNCACAQRFRLLYLWSHWSWCWRLWKPLRYQGPAPAGDPMIDRNGGSRAQKWQPCISEWMTSAMAGSAWAHNLDQRLLALYFLWLVRSRILRGISPLVWDCWIKVDDPPVFRPQAYKGSHGERMN